MSTDRSAKSTARSSKNQQNKKPLTVRIKDEQPPARSNGNQQLQRSGGGTTREDPQTKYEQYANEIKENVARNHLRTMMCKKNQELLGRSIERFKAEAGNPEDKDELSMRAEEELLYLQLRDELYAAMDNSDLDKLLEICSRVEEPEFKRFKNPLTADLMQARKLICILNRTVDLPARLNFDDKTMRELAQFSLPPKTVHDVVKASLLLLGEYEGHTSKWGYCRDLLRPYKSTGKGGLRYRVENFDPADVNPEIAGRSKEILERYKITDVFRVSEAAASLFVWTQSKLSETKAGAPANLARQREIFIVDMPMEKWRPKNSYY